jgi:hypothetical protein
VALPDRPEPRTLRVEAGSDRPAEDPFDGAVRFTVRRH